jgi:hypothetical protein
VTSAVSEPARLVARSGPVRWCGIADVQRERVAAFGDGPNDGVSRSSSSACWQIYPIGYKVKHMRRRSPALGATLAATALLASACGGDEYSRVASAPLSNARTESLVAAAPAAQGPVVIDVRTPEE